MPWTLDSELHTQASSSLSSASKSDQDRSVARSTTRTHIWSSTDANSVALTTFSNEITEQLQTARIGDFHENVARDFNHSSEASHTDIAGTTKVATDRIEDSNDRNTDCSADIGVSHVTAELSQNLTPDGAGSKVTYIDQSTADKTYNDFAGTVTSSTQKYSSVTDVTAEAASVINGSLSGSSNSVVNGSVDGQTVSIGMCNQTYFKLTSARVIVTSPITKYGTYPVNVRCNLVLATEPNLVSKYFWYRKLYVKSP